MYNRYPMMIFIIALSIIVSAGCQQKTDYSDTNSKNTVSTKSTPASGGNSVQPLSHKAAMSAKPKMMSE